MKPLWNLNKSGKFRMESSAVYSSLKSECHKNINGTFIVCRDDIIIPASTTLHPHRRLNQFLHLSFIVPVWWAFKMLFFFANISFIIRLTFMTMTENIPWTPQYVLHELFLQRTHTKKKHQVRTEKGDFARSRNWSILKLGFYNWSSLPWRCRIIVVRNCSTGYGWHLTLSFQERKDNSLKKCFILKLAETFHIFSLLRNLSSAGIKSICVPDRI